MSTDLPIRDIQRAIRERYAAVAKTAAGKFSYPTGRAGAVSLGYDAQLVATLPEAAVESFCGVGNPFRLGAIAVGATVLDIGCGAGFDVLVARQAVGDTGYVHGVDLTPAMAQRARQNVCQLGCNNVLVVQAEVEALPYATGSVDVVLSNGVLNLSPLKLQSWQEIYRVLKPGGWLQCADIVLQEALPPEVTQNLDAWSG